MMPYSSGDQMEGLYETLGTSDKGLNLVYFEKGSDIRRLGEKISEKVPGVYLKSIEMDGSSTDLNKAIVSAHMAAIEGKYKRSVGKKEDYTKTAVLVSGLEKSRGFPGSLAQLNANSGLYKSCLPSTILVIPEEHRKAVYDKAPELV